jgi:hypothetical protein
MWAKQEVLQSDQHFGQESGGQGHLRPGSRGSGEHESEERDRGYVHEGIGKPTAEAGESVAMVAVDVDREGRRIK